MERNRLCDLGADIAVFHAYQTLQSADFVDRVVTMPGLDWASREPCAFTTCAAQHR